VRKRSIALVGAALAAPVVVTAVQAPPSRDQSSVPPVALASGIRSVGTTSFVRRRTKTAGCTLGPLPDRACSPGALDTRRTSTVICSKSFHTSDVRNVPESVKHQVEIAYGLKPKRYGSTLEIDHIISLELGGSNDLANLYPELAPGYHAKDVLENRLHKLVCTGAITLHTAQRRIAADWVHFYRDVFAAEPVLTGSMRAKP
jgi:hypothetical protein